MADTTSYYDHGNYSFNSLKDAIKKLNERNPGRSERQDSAKVNDFSMKFDQVYEMITPLVEFVNNNYDGAKLFLYKDERSTRKFIQVTLSPDLQQPNLLQDPSFLIEGYPKMGEVRITGSKATEEGKMVNVNDVTPEFLESCMAHFLDTAVSSLK